jgi:hypothetical protein
MRANYDGVSLSPGDDDPVECLGNYMLLQLGGQVCRESGERGGLNFGFENCKTLHLFSPILMVAHVDVPHCPRVRQYQLPLEVKVSGGKVRLVEEDVPCDRTVGEASRAQQPAGERAEGQVAPSEIRPPLYVGGLRLAVGSLRLAVCGWRLAVGGWRLAVGGWRLDI